MARRSHMVVLPRRTIYFYVHERLRMRRHHLVVATLFVYALAMSSSSAHAGGLLKKIFKKKAEPAPACEPAPAPAPEPKCCEPAPPPPEPKCCEPAPEPAPACPEPAPAPACCEPAPEPPKCCAATIPAAGAPYVIYISEGPVYAMSSPIAIETPFETVVQTNVVRAATNTAMKSTHYVSFR